MKEKLQELHKINGFYVRVAPLKSGVGCFAEFPKNNDKKPFIAACVVDGENLKVIIEKEGESGESGSLTLPKEYMIPIISLDISILVKKHGMSDDLVFLEDGQDINKLTKISIDNLSEQRMLFVYGLQRLHSSLEVAPDNHQYDFIKQDYRDLCVKLVTNGGICNA